MTQHTPSPHRRPGGAARARDPRLAVVAMIALAAAALGALGWLMWSLPAAPLPPAARLVVLIDVSTTLPRDAACRSADRLARRELGNRSERVELMLFHTEAGTGTSAARQAATLVRPRVGATEGGDLLAEANEAVLSELHERCMALPDSDVSPLWAGLEGVLDDLRVAGSDGRSCTSERSRCAALFVTDGLEEVDPHLSHAVGTTRRVPRTEPTAPDLSGLDRVVVCGFGERVLSPGTVRASAGAVRQAWQARLDPTHELDHIELSNTCAPAVPPSN